MSKVYNSNLSENLISSKKLWEKKFLNFSDSLISFFIVSPLVVSFW
jgi:hypothetical protein